MIALIGAVLRSVSHRTDGGGFGAAANRRLRPHLVRSTFDSCHADTIVSHSRWGPGRDIQSAMARDREEGRGSNEHHDEDHELPLAGDRPANPMRHARRHDLFYPGVPIERLCPDCNAVRF